MADDVERTEEPTPKRRTEAQKEGQIAISQDAFIFANLTAVALALLWAGSFVLSEAASGFQTTWAPRDDLSLPEGVALFRSAFGHGLRIAAPMLLAALFAGIAVGELQTRGTLSPRRLRPKLSKLNPLQNAQRIFKLQGAIELPKSLLKLALVGGMTGAIVWTRLTDYLGLYQLTPLDSARFQLESLILTFLIGCSGMFLIAAIDYAYQSFRTERALRMSRTDVKEERKQSEGDPLIRARMRSLQLERARSRMMDAVPRADVVITNPTHVSVALIYQKRNMRAPTVLAKGRGHLALRIREIALECGIPIVEEPPLARTLYRLVKVNQQIPERLFQAVAQVLAYVQRLDPQRRRGW